MTTLLHRNVYGAMATAVERYNSRPAAAPDVDELRAEIRRLQRLVDDQALMIETLQAQLNEQQPVRGRGLAIDSRPVMTIADAAQAAGVSVATAWRYVQSGHWQARQQGSRWLVYADQPLSKKNRK